MAEIKRPDPKAPVSVAAKAAESGATAVASTPAIEAPKPDPEGWYVVDNAPIAPWGNSMTDVAGMGLAADGLPIARLYQIGEKIRISHKLARHYVKLDRLAPYIPDDDE